MQILLPVFQYLGIIDQNQRIDPPRRNQISADSCFAEGCRCAQNTDVMRQQGVCCALLLRVQLASKGNLYFSVRLPFVCDVIWNCCFLQQLLQPLHTATREADKIAVVMAAIDNARYSKR